MEIYKVPKLVCIIYFTTLFICEGLVFETTEDSHGLHNLSGNNFTELTTFLTLTKETRETTTESQHFSFDFHLQFIPLIVNRFGLNSDECSWRTRCDSVIQILGRTCYCDTLCSVFNDCCENIANSSLLISENIPYKHQFDCLLLTLRNFKLIESHVVTKCSPKWGDIIIKDLCENVNDDQNIVLKVFVTDSQNFVYRNMYCAYCNFQFDFDFWTVEERCMVTQNKTSDCKLFYGPPVNHSLTKSCRKKDFISKCSSQLDVVDIDEQHKKCVESGTSFVYTFTSFNEKYEFTKYKNKYCALCNNADEDLLLCHTGLSDSGGGLTPVPPVYSFRVLVDLNTLGNGNMNDFFCRNDQIYDAISEKCRQIFCPKTTIFINGRCMPEISALQNETGENETGCAFIKLKSNEWQSVNKSNIKILALEKIVNSSMFYFNGTDVYICADIFENQLLPIEFFIFSSAESYVTLCGLVFSICALTITLIVYCMFPELLNVPGKILSCLTTSLILAQLSFLFISHVEAYSIMCKSLAIIVHYFYTASFTWMNMIAFDLLITFSRSFIVSAASKTSKRFCMYSVYGWFLPLVIVATAVGIDEFGIDHLSEFRPGYGQRICWITSMKALVLFFVGPLALFKVIDVIGFIFTSYFIAKARKIGSREKNNGKFCSFLLYLKLSMVMGLTWVFAFLATFTDNTVTWYMFIIFNTLQGVFIAMSFLCTRKVFNLIKNKIPRLKDVQHSTTLSNLRK